MKDFLLITNSSLVKVIFEESINGHTIKYRGNVYDVKEISGQETTQEVQYTFSFSRKEMTWDTLIDFTLESKTEQDQNIKDFIQDIIVNGIREYEM